MKALGVILFSVTSFILAYLMFCPAPINAQAWTPSVAPSMSGALAPNNRLDHTVLLAEGVVEGPEDIEVDQNGDVFVSERTGDITKITADGTIVKLINTGGRPLGLDIDASGNLIIADAVKGLLMYSTDGELSTLVDQYDGVKLKFTDDVDIAEDGMIYFSDASTKHNYHDKFEIEILESSPYGRLFSYSPSTGETNLLVEGLYFANGVAVAKNQQYVLVNETFRYQITRYWIDGPKKGQSDIFATNLAGWPDGVSTAPDGSYWIAMFGPRTSDLDELHPNAWLKNIFSKMPDWALGEPPKYGLVVRIDESGQVLESLHAPDGRQFCQITSAEQFGDRLYLGTLNRSRAGYVQL